ncbi:hypothetical protein N7462_011071 [Penicillium macrosclerotiorum]|uniref:uncharacterized protein n=1 Tax=Penicillium macrosclerotiorum TaxID=303699 RepID=UPI0025468E30|nr:uncharacterized protein N7462_011071 [Penicillium macrosclerotiorum]KAJ5666662.1 hypothetical protein N7462_011071 [Penicillium macrosclerotiorum]
MDYYRRVHQNSYPPRPSPLSNSQQPSDDRSHSYSASTRALDPRRVPDNEKTRSTGRYEYPQTPSSHLYSPGTSRPGSHALRAENAAAQISPPRNHHAHRRHASLERHASLDSRHHPYAHRRNNSQPLHREGKKMHC